MVVEMEELPLHLHKMELQTLVVAVELVQQIELQEVVDQAVQV